jgi:FkbM family methyltransferase
LLIPISHLKRFWRLNPRGVVHVGAHEAEERWVYEKYGFGPVVWIEAQENLAIQLSREVASPSVVVHALVWNLDGELMTLNITNNGQSSSVFDLGTHKDSYPEIHVSATNTVLSSRLDTILGADFSYNFLNLDIQGAEFEALEGLGEQVSKFDFVYTEVNLSDVYLGIHHVADLDTFLGNAGFRRVASAWTHQGWGDALYLRIDWIGDSLGSRAVIWLKILTYGIYLSFKRLTPANYPRLLRSFLKKLNQNKAQ